MLVHRINRPKEMSGTTSSYESPAWAKGKRGQGLLLHLCCLQARRNTYGLVAVRGGWPG